MLFWRYIKIPNPERRVCHLWSFLLLCIINSCCVIELLIQRPASRDTRFRDLNNFVMSEVIVDERHWNVEVWTPIRLPSSLVYDKVWVSQTMRPLFTFWFVTCTTPSKQLLVNDVLTAKNVCSRPNHYIVCEWSSTTQFDALFRYCWWCIGMACRKESNTHDDACQWLFVYRPVCVCVHLHVCECVFGSSGPVMHVLAHLVIRQGDAWSAPRFGLTVKRMPWVFLRV